MHTDFRETISLRALREALALAECAELIAIFTSSTKTADGGK
jgi:hypothetical protein